MNESSDNTEKSVQAGLNPMLMIGQGINDLIKWYARRILDDVASKLMSISSQLSQLATLQQKNAYAIGALEKQLASIGVQNQLLEAASRENARLSQEYYQDHIIKPMVGNLFPVLDLIEDAQNSWAEHACVIEPHVKQLIEGIHAQLCQFLAVYQIEQIKHQPGSEFDPQLMKPARVVPAGTEELDNRIAKSLQAGFRCSRSGQLLRPESVIVCSIRGV